VQLLPGQQGSQGFCWRTWLMVLVPLLLRLPVPLGGRLPAGLLLLLRVLLLLWMVVLLRVLLLLWWMWLL